MISIIRLIRLKSWTKNLLCFAGLIFSGNLGNYNYLYSAFWLFISFSFISSSIYVFNDIIDKDSDSLHPKKKNRPLASGKISVGIGYFVAIFFLTLGLFGSFKIGLVIFGFIIFYIINNIFYTFILKKVPLLDVFSISVGFLIRLVTGIYLVGENPTNWIVLCTMFLALFLGFAKRRAEIHSIGNRNEFKQRPVLKLYNKDFLDALVNETAFGAIISYSLFASISGKNQLLVITIPIVYFAISYYRQSLFNNELGEEPESVILENKVIITCIFAWIVTYIFLTY